MMQYINTTLKNKQLQQHSVVPMQLISCCIIALSIPNVFLANTDISIGFGWSHISRYIRQAIEETHGYITDRGAWLSHMVNQLQTGQSSCTVKRALIRVCSIVFDGFFSTQFDDNSLQNCIISLDKTKNCFVGNIYTTLVVKSIVIVQFNSDCFVETLKYRDRQPTRFQLVQLWHISTLITCVITWTQPIHKFNQLICTFLFTLRSSPHYFNLQLLYIFIPIVSYTLTQLSTLV